MAFSAQHRAADLRLEWHLVVLAAMVANYLEFRRSVFPRGGFLRAALLATLRRRHVPLVKHLLVFFSEEKGLLALNAYCFYIGHCVFRLLGAL